MMQKSTKPIDYQELSAELEAILIALQQANGDVDQALTQYERGLEVVKLLEAHLKTAEHKIIKLQAGASDR